MSALPAAVIGELHPAAAQLCGRYVQALDERDWDGLAEVFAPDGAMDFAHLGVRVGPEAIARVCAEALEPLDGSQHLLGSIAVRADGETFLCRSYFHAQHLRGGQQFVIAGSYTDRLVRTELGWRIARREQSVAWTSGDPGVLGNLDI